MHKGEDMLPALEALHGELNMYLQLNNGAELQVEIWTTMELLKKIRLISHDEIQVVMEAVIKLREDLKGLEGKGLQAAEERVAELRRDWIKTVEKPFWKRAKEVEKGAKRERRKSIQKRSSGKENRELKK